MCNWWRKYRRLNSDPSSTRLSTCRKVLIGLSSFLAIVSVVLLFGGYSAIVNKALQNNLQITNGSKAYKIWKDIPVPLYMRLYIFNLTNPDEFLKGADPIVNEVGPYTFSEYHHKKNISFHSNNTVTYMQERMWKFEQHLSNGNSLDTKFTIVNVIPVTAAHAVRKHALLLTALNEYFIVIKEKSIITKSAREILFEGYEDPVLKSVEKLKNILKKFNIPIPKGIADFDRFGWFYKRNNSLTYDGIYNMFTGEDNLQNVGKIDLWNHERKTNFFDGKECDEITGSTGEIWPPGVQKKQLEFFNSDICTSLKLPFTEEVIDSNGIRGYKFSGTENTFERENKKCFCVNGTCTPRGTLNAESCRMGAPAAVSFPHFLYADPSLLKKVHGLKPNPKNHTFYLSVIPEIGVPLDVAARVQINMQITPYREPYSIFGTVRILEYVPEVLLPMIWFEVTTSIDEDTASQLIPVIFILSTQILTIIFGALLIVSFMAIIIAALPLWCTD